MQKSNAKFKPSAEQYKSALLTLEESGKIGEKIKTMLRCNYHAPNRTATYSQLAQAAGYKTFSGANSQYGKFGHLLGNFLKMEFEKSTTRKNGELFYSSAIGHGIAGNGLQHFKLKMHPELASALEMLKWTADNTKNDHSNEAHSNLFTNSNSEDDSQNLDDKKRYAEIEIRRGQPTFRKLLIDAYKGKCAVTQTSIEGLLEAAHIIPHAEEANYSARNGLLLRSDIHTLFDLKLLSIDQYMRIHLSKLLKNTKEYGHLDGARITLPESSKNTPDHTALNTRHNRFLEAEKKRNSF